ncbi:hypothetical protein DB30_01846 [Enhygromyxa salina]|uniref:Uncharacterized protein n=1 Tax=Enhygromyxa salina TaxID=215803 RepID=A0A0C1ZMF8_9BACT|nr:hypothetical protein [Enhygromyxa salina]KIG12163.1 hypothetical protein DB30_01846 [Enhygromyxa salina]
MAGPPTHSEPLEPAQAQDHDGAWVLAQIANELEAEGLEVEQLRDLTEELAIIERPPGLLRRVTKRARAVAVEQWSHLVGELQESREAVALVRARGARELSEEERAIVREQMLDLVRLFPAGLIAAVNSALPVPGTSVFTPWLLVKLGLMPSRWRESHLLDQLRRQQLMLQRTGHASQAERIGAVLLQLETEAEERELIQRETRLLTHWDENGNGLWDEAELEAYGREVDKVRALVRVHAARKRWFFEHEGEVYGAARLSEIEDLGEAASSLLVCFDGRTGWVALEHVLESEADAG